LAQLPVSILPPASTLRKSIKVVDLFHKPVNPDAVANALSAEQVIFYRRATEIGMHLKRAE